MYIDIAILIVEVFFYNIVNILEKCNFYCTKDVTIQLASDFLYF